MLSNILASTEIPNLERGRNKGFQSTDLPNLAGVAHEEGLDSLRARLLGFDAGCLSADRRFLF